MSFVDFDLRIFSLTAIKKSVHKLSGRYNFAIEPLGDQTIRVHVQGLGGDAFERVASNVQLEVLDQDLRESIGRQTEAVRNLILAQAFSKTAILDPSGEHASFADDPLGIARQDA